MIGGLLVDPQDEHFLAAYTWTVTRRKHTSYATTRPGIYLHQLIMNAPPGMEVDHRNGNGLDNRRANLRLATKAQQQGNSPPHGGVSRFKGVAWDKRRSKWWAQLRARGERQWLGYFTDEADAARAYDAAAREAFGEFARLNYPEEG